MNSESISIRAFVSSSGAQRIEVSKNGAIFAQKWMSSCSFLFLYSEFFLVALVKLDLLCSKNQRIEEHEHQQGGDWKYTMPVARS